MASHMREFKELRRQMAEMLSNKRDLHANDQELKMSGSKAFKASKSYTFPHVTY